MRVICKLRIFNVCDDCFKVDSKNFSVDIGSSCFICGILNFVGSGYNFEVEINKGGNIGN